LIYEFENYLDRNEAAEAVRGFNKGKKDVLILTDIVSKGLDLQNVKHVISFSMPKEVYL